MIDIGNGFCICEVKGFPKEGQDPEFLAENRLKYVVDGREIVWSQRSNQFIKSRKNNEEVTFQTPATWHWGTLTFSLLEAYTSFIIIVFTRTDWQDAIIQYSTIKCELVDVFEEHTAYIVSAISLDS